MKKNRSTTILALGFFILNPFANIGADSTQAQIYTITDLGTLGGSATFPGPVNELGQTAGGGVAAKSAARYGCGKGLANSMSTDRREPVAALGEAAFPHTYQHLWKTAFSLPPCAYYSRMPVSVQDPTHFFLRRPTCSLRPRTKPHHPCVRAGLAPENVLKYVIIWHICA